MFVIINFFTIINLAWLFRYQKMLECWNLDPLTRPTFDLLEEFFHSICAEGHASESPWRYIEFVVYDSLINDRPTSPLFLSQMNYNLVDKH